MIKYLQSCTLKSLLTKKKKKTHTHTHNINKGTQKIFQKYTHYPAFGKMCSICSSHLLDTEGRVGQPFLRQNYGKKNFTIFVHKRRWLCFGFRNSITFKFSGLQILDLQKPYHLRQWRTISTDVTVVTRVCNTENCPQSHLFYCTTMTKMRFNLECKKQLTRPQKFVPMYFELLNKTIDFIFQHL